jgi:hypothetical protein
MVEGQPRGVDFGKSHAGLREQRLEQFAATGEKDENRLQSAEPNFILGMLPRCPAKPDLPFPP